MFDKMNETEKRYARASLAVFTEEELRRAKENFDYGARRFPEEHARALATMEAKNLGAHREVVSYYVSHRMPISDQELGVIGLYKDSTYVGAFGVGEEKAAQSTTAGGTRQDAIFTPAFKPEGA